MRHQTQQRSPPPPHRRQKEKTQPTSSSSSDAWTRLAPAAVAAAAAAGEERARVTPQLLTLSLSLPHPCPPLPPPHCVALGVWVGRASHYPPGPVLLARMQWPRWWRPQQRAGSRFPLLLQLQWVLRERAGRLLQLQPSESRDEKALLLLLLLSVAPSRAVQTYRLRLQQHPEQSPQLLLRPVRCRCSSHRLLFHRFFPRRLPLLLLLLLQSHERAWGL